MKNKFLTLIAVAAAFTATSAFALDLASARTSGLVGELPTGYIAPIQQNKDSAELVSSVNAKRKQEYARISAQNGQPVDVVAKLAAAQIIEKLPKGAQYQDASGAWVAR